MTTNIDELITQFTQLSEEDLRARGKALAEALEISPLDDLRAAAEVAKDTARKQEQEAKAEADARYQQAIASAEQTRDDAIAAAEKMRDEATTFASTTALAVHEREDGRVAAAEKLRADQERALRDVAKQLAPSA